VGHNSVTEVLTASIEIGAPADTVYWMVTDVTATGRRSPECRRSRWVTGDRAVTGARFTGHNRQRLLRWSTLCEVEAADGQQFVFKTIKGAAGRRTRWRYEIEPTACGTLVTETCEPISFKRSSALSVVINLLRGGGDRTAQVRQGMHTTLANLKREAENTAARP
jgi:hypothetical protein